MKGLTQYIFPGFLILIGLILLIAGFTGDQNSWFIMGSLSILIVGVITLLSAMDIISKGLRTIMVIGLALIAVGLTALDYKSIKDPIDFMEERDRRYEHVKERLIDIRTAQMAFKSKYGSYADNFNTLEKFVKQDSFQVILAIGTVPDTLTEDSAVALGIVRRDTSMIPVQDSIFSTRYIQTREHPFHVDSIRYVPFTGGAEFNLEATTIKRNSVDIPVFMAEDSKPYDKEKVYRVGSLSDPSTSGNWE